MMFKSYSHAGIFTALFMALLPFAVSQSLFYGATNAKYFLIVGATTLLGLYFAYSIFTGNHAITIRRRYLLLAMGIVLAVQYISAFSGVYTGGSFFSDIQRSTGVLFLTYIAFLAFIVSELLTKNDWKLVRRAVVVSSSLFALITFFGGEGLRIFGKSLWFDLGAPGQTFGNTTFAGAYLLLGFVVTLIEIARSEKGSKVRRYLYGLLIVQFASPMLFGAGLWGGVYAWGSIDTYIGVARASSVTAVLVLIFMTGRFLLRKYIKNTARKYSLITYNIVWVVAVVGTSVLLFVPGSFIQKEHIKQSTPARTIVWESTLKSVSEHALFGWGPENFRLAYNTNFDNRLYLNENGGEIWFDKAHNVVIDTLVGIGVVGLVSFVGIVAMILIVANKARKRGLISSTESTLLGILIFAHFLQMQTSFDTVATYALFGILFGYILSLEKKTLSGTEPIAEKNKTLLFQNGIVVIFVALILVGGWFSLVKEYSRQRSLHGIFTSTGHDRQLVLIDRALGGSYSFEALRLASASMVEGFFQNPNLAAISPEDRAALVERAHEQLSAYESHYGVFLERLPFDYRTRMNYANILIAQMVLGEDREEEVDTLIQESYVLSQNNPLTYVLDAVNQFYEGNVDDAKDKISEGIALNPEIEFTQVVLKYIEQQERNLPRVGVFRFENL